MKSADISIIGPDRKGIVATITNFIFDNQCNIEEVSQNVVNGTFFMKVKISINKKKFDKAFPNLAKKYDIQLIPFLLHGVALKPELNLSDGMHPNEKGVLIISETIKKSVIKILD